VSCAHFAVDSMAAIQTMQQGLTTDTAGGQTGTSFTFDASYAGNTGNDLGISTSGYRTGKYNPQEWHSANYGMTYRSTADREAAGKVCMAAVWFSFVHFLHLVNIDVFSNHSYAESSIAVS
jgi:hypothetical protein